MFDTPVIRIFNQDAEFVQTASAALPLVSVWTLAVVSPATVYVLACYVCVHVFRLFRMTFRACVLYINRYMFFSFQ